MTQKGKTYTTFSISRICDVYPTTVANWIDEGKLKAFITPGGHRRVSKVDLIEFLKKHNMPMPDKFKDSYRQKILVVDDDRLVRDSIIKVLENKKKYDIYYAVDGFEAGQVVGLRKPDLVILDIMLPKMDGFRVCGLIKKYNAETKILAITGYDTPENRERILESGADDYMGKPFGMNKLLNKVEKNLGK